ncbi:EamA family transporter [Microvirgula aerodenitrificans]|uniref:DMT family transporter n=1 Tax=Microvirgula aerodenitrificans TaxID=57480 RepID=UPI0028EE5C0C|nr:EamA family transporter [Microvirgula aerodenitrificans]
MKPAADAITCLKLCLVSMIWGGTFVAGRFLSDEMPPLLSASLRFVMASLALLGFLLLSRIPLVRLNTRQFLQLLLLGFFGIFLYNLCFFYGLREIGASRAALIVALNPAVMALVARVFLRDSLSIGQLSGIALCLAGAGMVILGHAAPALAGNAGSRWGDALILGCVASWVIYSVCARELSATIGPLQTVTLSILLGTAMLCAATLALGQMQLASLARVSGPGWLSLLYLGVVGSALAYIWYYDGIARIGVTRAGSFIALNPLTAVLSGALLLGETLTWRSCAGGGLIIAGILLCNAGARLRLAWRARLQASPGSR